MNHWFSNVHKNTARRLIDSNTNQVAWAWDSTAFGLGGPEGTITFNLRFPGQYYDVGTNQFYNHNRYYNPELGRYMEPDPIGLEGGLNPYAYAGSNPLMNVDPSGLDFQKLSNWYMSNVITSQASHFASIPKDYFRGDFPTVAQANANLIFNGGSGRDLNVNASRLMVEPNGSGQWGITSSGNTTLGVRVTGYRNDFGNWISSKWSTIPSNQNRGYWVYGELTMSSNGKLYSDTYNFEQHKHKDLFNNNSGFISTYVSNSLNAGRNLLTEIGAANAGGIKSFDIKSGVFKIDDGYKINFFNKPYCPSCPIPSMR